MSRHPLFSIQISTDLPDVERESLLLVLRRVVDVEVPVNRISGAEWVTFVAVMKDMATLAGTAAALVKLANEINTWRRNAQQRAIEPQVTLQHPDKDPLKLTTATDEEVQTWLSQEKQS